MDNKLRLKVAQRLCECNAKDWEDLDQLGQESYLRAAGAVIEVIKEKGTLMPPERMELIAPDRIYPMGYLVFIEE